MVILKVLGAILEGIGYGVLDSIATGNIFGSIPFCNYMYGIGDIQVLSL